MKQAKQRNTGKQVETSHYIEDSLAVVNAIRSGEVDAFVVCEPDGECVYMLGRGHPPYQKMIEEMKEGAALLTPAGDILYCNAHLANLLGRSAKDLLMVQMSQWVADDNRPAFERCIQEGEQRSTHIEFRLACGSGNFIPARLTASPMKVDGANVVSITVSDLSQYYQIESERAARNEAVHANHLKDEYMAMVSHELRNPLNVIMSWVTTLQAKTQDPNLMAHGLSAIERSARSQVKIIDDILDINRIASGSLRLELETIDLAVIARTAFESMERLISEKHIRAATTSESVFVTGDPNRLNQVVCNILSNAIKFTPNGGTIHLSVRREQGKAYLRVTDSGIGIEPVFLPHVFEPFRQAVGSSTRRIGGLGLGLAIVKHVIALHNGEVSVESAGVNQGTSFVVALPIVMPHARTVDVTSEPRLLVPEPDLHGVSILVVDDDIDSCEAVRRFLIAYHATVSVASSTEEALRKMDAFHPDVLVSDIAMPDVDGYDLIQRVRATERDPERRIVAIALTAFVRSEDRERALLAGYDRHLSKPVTLSILASLIHTLTMKPR